MSKDYLLGVDIGTLGVKVCIIRVDGHEKFTSYIEHDVITPKLGWSEQNPDIHWWGDTVKGIKYAISQAKIDPQNIRAIGIVGLYPCMCPLDKNGEVIRNAILYSDNRSNGEVKYLREKYGLNITTEELISKILWFKRNEPDNFARTKIIINPTNYVVYKLTGHYCTDYLLAVNYGEIFDMTKKRWKEDVLNELGIPIEILPPTFSSIDVIGSVTREASHLTGLANETPVIVGTGDVLAQMLGCTVINPEDALIYYGTAGLFLILRKSIKDLLVGNFAELNECIFLATYVLTTGELLKWFVKVFLKYQESFIQDLSMNIYSWLDEKVSKISPGSDGLLIIPYLRGERVPSFNPAARGVIYGLDIFHTTYHVYRALLESFGYMVRLGYELARENGIGVKRVVCGGGGARSLIWRQIVSDILNMPQEYPENADASLGAAFLAGLGIGLIKDVEEIYSWIPAIYKIQPQHIVSEKYNEIYRKFLQLHDLLFA